MLMAFPTYQVLSQVQVPDLYLLFMSSSFVFISSYFLVHFTPDYNFLSKSVGFFLSHFEKEPAQGSKRKANSYYFAFILQVLEVGKQFAPANSLFTHIFKI